MKKLLVLLALSFCRNAYSAPAYKYKLEQIKAIDDGRLGTKKFYFDVACNQDFLQVLSEETNAGSLNVAILTLLNDRDCSGPDRRVFVRFAPHGQTVTAVSDFDEVWSCRGYCFTPGGPDMPPYNRPVQAYGTSERQATDYLGCSKPYLQDLSCEVIDATGSK